MSWLPPPPGFPTIHDFSLGTIGIGIVVWLGPLQQIVRHGKEFVARKEDARAQVGVGQVGAVQRVAGLQRRYQGIRAGMICRHG